jgi:hypothetical protein
MSHNQDHKIAGKAKCGCWYHAEDGIPCEHDIALANHSAAPPDCPTCPDGGRVGPSAVDNDWYCYECCNTF